MPLPPKLPQLPSRIGILAERLRSRGGGGGLKDRVAEALDTEVKQRAIIVTGQEAAPAAGPSDATRRALETGVEVITNLDPATALSPAQQAAAEAVIHLTERPALLVQRDNFPTPAAPWELLDNPHRKPIRRNLPCVGRIAITLNGKRSMTGTGFAMGPDLVLTNKHVAYHPEHAPIRFAIQDPGGKWQVVTAKEPTIDFKGEHGIDGERIFKIKGIAAMHPNYDMCLLRVEAGAGFPKPLKIASDEPAATNDVYVVGYPAGDDSGATPFKVLKEIFGGVFEVKRLQPGELVKDFPDYGIFAHDCSTLGGNSGSCVIDLKADRIVGLHFSGRYRETNWAVALWRLADDPFFGDNGIELD